MFVLPENLKTLSLEELAALETLAISEFKELQKIDIAELSDEQLDRIDELSAAVSTIRTHGAERQADARKRADRVAAAADLLTASDETPDTEETGEPEVEETVEETTETVETTDPAPVEAPDLQVEEAVVASARRAPSLIKTTPKPKVTQVKDTKSAVTLTAAADVPNVPMGKNFVDLDEVAVAFSNRANMFPRSGHTPGLWNRHGVATISRGGDFDGLSDDNPDFRDGGELINAAGKESRLAGNSLVAAGGWCAPSETLYDLCSNESLDGLVDVPEIRLTRGGIRFTQGPDFSTIYDSIGFCQTEAEAIAGTPKPCFEIPCPDFEDHRLDACGICIKAPILTNAGYPELVRRWIEGALVAHQHKMSAKTLTDMATLLGPPQILATPGSQVWSNLTSLELAAEGLRYRWRLARGTAMEVILPYWYRVALRSDLANRNGRPSAQVSDAELDAHFAERLLRVQWVYDWQPLVNAPAGDCTVDFPATVQAMIYPAGTFIRGVADVISLDAIYDTTNLQLNMYTAVFMEEGTLVAKRCNDGCLLQFPICPTGRTGAADVTACFDATA